MPQTIRRELTKMEFTDFDFATLEEGFRSQLKNKKIINALHQIYFERLKINDLIIFSGFQLRKTRIRSFFESEVRRILNKKMTLQQLRVHALENYQLRKEGASDEDDFDYENLPYPSLHFQIACHLLEHNRGIQEIKRMKAKSFLGNRFLLGKQLQNQVIKDLIDDGLLDWVSKSTLKISKQKIMEVKEKHERR